MSNVIPLLTKRRIIQADARIQILENLLRTWVGYCDQAGEGTPFDELNPVHVLLRDTKSALESK